MKELQVFQNSEFGRLEVLMIEGKEHFPASACAKTLGYTNPHKAIKDHCKSDIKRWVNDSLGRQQETKYIPEGDLYRLIVRSKLPSAERFERWVFDEVLPNMRKQGGYVTRDQLSGIIEETTAVLVSAVIKELMPLLERSAAPAPTGNISFKELESSMQEYSRCKLECFPQSIRTQVDGLLAEMLATEALNFSRIARFCTLHGYPISSPSVKTYFERRLQEV